MLSKIKKQTKPTTNTYKRQSARKNPQVILYLGGMLCYNLKVALGQQIAGFFQIPNPF